MLKEHIDKIVNIRQDIANLKTDVDTNKSSITSLMTAKEEEMNNKLDGIKL
jgi:hypothetical protein